MRLLGDPILISGGMVVTFADRLVPSFYKERVGLSSHGLNKMGGTSWLASHVGQAAMSMPMLGTRGVRMQVEGWCQQLVAFWTDLCCPRFGGNSGRGEYRKLNSCLDPCKGKDTSHVSFEGRQIS